MSAFCLLFIIAKRAKRSSDHPDKSLEIGEAEVGDYETYGVTRQVYRSDLNFLKTNHLVTIRTTNKGTIVKLIDTDIFDINQEEVTTKINESQPTTNQQLTTNKNDKNDKKIIKRKIYKKKKLEKQKEEEQKKVNDEMLRIIEAFNKVHSSVYRLTDGIKFQLTYWLRQYSVDEIIKAIDKQPLHPKLSVIDNLTGFLKAKDKKGEPLDLIGSLLNFHPPKPKDDLNLGWNPHRVINR